METNTVPLLQSKEADSDDSQELNSPPDDSQEPNSPPDDSQEPNRPSDDSDEPKGPSFLSAVSNLSNTIVGAGIMTLPVTMKVLGLIPGIAMIVFVAFLTDYSVKMLIKFSRAGKVNSYGGSYGGVMEDAFGGRWRMILQICVFLSNIGVMVVYMIIIGDVLSGTSSSGGSQHTGVLEEWFGHHWWNSRFFVLLCTSLSVFAPLACFRRADSLRYTSAISFVLAVLFVVVTVAILILKFVKRGIETPRLLPEINNLASVWNLFTAVPVLVTAFVCHYYVHSIENEVKNPLLFQCIVRTSLLLCSILYIATGFCAYFLFGEHILDDVLINFNSKLAIRYSSVLTDIVRVSYALHLMLAFPVIFFALRLNVNDLLLPLWPPSFSNNNRFASVTVGLLSMVFMFANLIPCIWDSFSTAAAVCIGFIFPAAITLRDHHSIATRRDKMMSVFIIVLAVLSIGIAIYNDLT